MCGNAGLMQNSQQMNDAGFNPAPSSLLGSDWNSLVDLCSEIQESNFRNELRLSDFADDVRSAVPGLGMSLDVDVKNEPISPPPEAVMSNVRCPSQQQQHQQQSLLIPSQQHLSLQQDHHHQQRPQTGQALRSVVSERQFLSVPSAVDRRYQNCQPIENQYLSANGGTSNHDLLFDACSTNGDLCFPPVVGSMLLAGGGEHRLGSGRSAVRPSTRDQCYASIQSGLAPRNQRYDAFQSAMSPQTSGQFLAAPSGGLTPSEPQRQFHHLGQAGISSSPRDHPSPQMARPQVASDAANILNSSFYQCYRNVDNLYSNKRPRLTADDWLS